MLEKKLYYGNVKQISEQSFIGSQQKTNASHEVSNQMVCSSMLKGGTDRMQREREGDLESMC